MVEVVVLIVSGEVYAFIERLRRLTDGSKWFYWLNYTMSIFSGSLSYSPCIFLYNNKDILSNLVPSSLRETEK